ncbi:MAG: hypothetical protein P8N30_03360 [Tateyamaria sp.]|nr:hypothetical protein [Tateyamaria sp.]MDG1334804.1 hypothetical protein [Tateyamaria sp.]MDG2058370.1 hypothetical protein [Tateyamaria sp.]
MAARDGTVTHSWTEVQSLAIRAARGADVPAAQASNFGNMLTRHLADGRDEAPLSEALKTQGAIVDLALRVEKVIEAASISSAPVSLSEDAPYLCALLVSWFNSLPCRTQVQLSGNTMTVTLSLSEPNARARPARITLSAEFYAQMHDLAANTYVPDSEASRMGGAGAEQMGLD